MIADSRHLPLKDNSVNCIITSPPYWSLRKYDIPNLIWDGNFPTISSEGCEHEWINDPVPGEKSGKPGPNATVGARFEQDAIRRRPPTNTCNRCGAWRGQLGLEPTIDLYLKHLLQIMDECKRLLRDDGTCWINIGDSYGGNQAHSDWKAREDYPEEKKTGGFHSKLVKEPWKGFKKEGVQKSLCLIPERFAIEMVDRGWILRNKIIWHKPNCMPASVKDRFTVDFEPVFFFVKSKKYWFEQQYEPLNEATIERSKYHWCKPDNKASNYQKLSGLNRDEDYPINPQGRNRRCVWTIPTQPYPESHFATFPEALIEPMIRAGCPKEICVKCGKAREKIISTTYEPIRKSKIQDQPKQKARVNSQVPAEKPFGFTQYAVANAIRTVDGITDCGCNAGFRPGVCLDPFCGSGTTMRVAEKLNRMGIGFDLAYEGLQNKRMRLIQKEIFV